MVTDRRLTRRTTLAAGASSLLGGLLPRIAPAAGRLPPGKVLAGAGIRGGMVHGSSDRHAAYIQDKPVHIRDIVATIYHCLGIDPATSIRDQQGRPLPIAHGGAPISEILA